MVEIARAETPEELAEVAALFKQYAASQPDRICFPGFDREIATLPGIYAPPGGVWLARAHGHALGCVGLCQVADGGELRRLYVRPEARGRGLGKRLVLTVLEAAREAGWPAVRLSTRAHMVEAMVLYRALGFETTPAPADDDDNARIWMATSIGAAPALAAAEAAGAA